MSSRLSIATFIWLALLWTPASAQETTPLALTLRAAVAEARAHHPELALLRQEYDAARAAPAGERYLAPPMLESQIWGWPVTTANPWRTEMYMLTAEQELPGRGKRDARVRVAEREADMSERRIAVRANAILADLQEAYIDLLFTRETFALYARQAVVLEDVAEAATRRYAAGEGIQHHSVAAVVELAALERERLAADERAQAAEARVNTLLGRPVAQRVEALAPIVPLVPPAEAEQLAMARFPEFAMAEAAVLREEAELDRLRGERRPDFVVGGGYMLTPGEAGAWTARAGLTWPNAPWSRGRLTVAIDAQSRRLAAAKARHAVIASEVRQVVRSSVIRLTAAERQMRLIETTVLPQVEHTFELARLAYASGGGEFSDMLDAQRMLLRTSIDYVETRAGLARARAALDRVAGAL